MNEKTNNMFGGFFFGLLGVYLFYYVGMIGYDLYVADKMGETENVSKEIDIAAAASSYVPKDVRTLFAEDKRKPRNESPSEDEASNNGGIAEHIENEYQEGFSVTGLTELFEQESQTPSLFSGIQMSM